MGENDPENSIDRRTVLKGLGAGAAAIGGMTGVSSAHHVSNVHIHDIPEVVDLGDVANVVIHWESGHGEYGRFLAAVAKPEEANEDSPPVRNPTGDWIELARTTRNLPEAGAEETFTMEVPVPEDLEPGRYRLRVSTSEAGVSFRDDNWPLPGECDYPIECDEPGGLDEDEWKEWGGIDAEEPNEAPVADLDVEPPEPGISLAGTDTTAVTGTEVTLDAGPSTDPDGTIESYEWEFGDGSTYTGRTVEHAFDEPGWKTVEITVTDDYGASRSEERTLAVGPEMEIDVTPTRPIDVVDCYGEADGGPPGIGAGRAPGEAPEGGPSGGTGGPGAGGTPGLAEGARPGPRTGPSPGNAPSKTGVGQCDIPVLIRGDEELDPTELDVSTLRFGAREVVDAGGGASPVSSEPKQPSFAGRDTGNLLVHFPAEGSGITPETEDVKLVGRTGSGEVAEEGPGRVAAMDAHDGDLEPGLPCSGTRELNR